MSLASFGDGGIGFDLNSLTDSFLSCNATPQSSNIPGSPEPQRELGRTTVTGCYMHSVHSLL